MKDQVLRAGKYAFVGIILFTALPLLIPLSLLSFFAFALALGCALAGFVYLGFALVLPVGCALAGFLHLRKYMGLFYWKLPALVVGSSRGRSRGTILAAPRVHGTWSALSLKDLQAAETVEDVDQEFDAVVVSIVPTGVLESEASDSLEGVPLCGTSANYGSSRDGQDVANQCQEERQGIDTFAFKDSIHSASRSGRCQEEQKERSSEADFDDSREYHSSFIGEQKQEEEAEEEQSDNVRDEKVEGVGSIDLPEDDGTSANNTTLSIQSNKKRFAPRGSTCTDKEHLRHASQCIPRSADQSSYVCVVAEGEGKRPEILREDPAIRLDARKPQTLVQKVGGEESKFTDEELLKEDAAEKEGLESVIDIRKNSAARDVGISRTLHYRLEMPEVWNISLTTETQEDHRPINLISHQENKEDIWICEECGWKFSSAKPNAKTRMDHEKHCQGHGSNVAAFHSRVCPDRPFEALEIDRTLSPGMVVKAALQDDFCHGQIEDSKQKGVEWKRHPERDMPSWAFVPAEITQEFPKAVDTESGVVEQASSSQYEAPENEPGSSTTGFASTFQIQENGHNLGSESLQVQNGASPGEIVLKSLTSPRTPVFDENPGVVEEHVLTACPRSAAASKSLSSVPGRFTDEISLKSSRCSVLSKEIQENPLEYDEDSLNEFWRDMESRGISMSSMQKTSKQRPKG